MSELLTLKIPGKHHYGYEAGWNDAIDEVISRSTPWRPIAEAPRDGGPVDLWIVFPNKAYRWASAQWLEKHNCSGPANWCLNNMPLHAYMDKPVATHFMPLPAPPTN